MKTKLMEDIKAAFQVLFDALDELLDWYPMAMPFPAGRSLTPVEGGIKPATFSTILAAHERVKVALKKLDKHQSKWDNASDLKKFFTESADLRKKRQQSREWLRGAEEALADISRAYNELIDVMVALYGSKLDQKDCDLDGSKKLATAAENLQAAMEGRPRVERRIAAIDENVQEFFDTCNPMGHEVGG